MNQGCVFVVEAREGRFCMGMIADIARGVGTGTGFMVCAVAIMEGVAELVDSTAI